MRKENFTLIQMKACGPGWYRCENSQNTVLVFVHGLNSSAQTCWTSLNQSWPNLIANDERFNGYDIYLSEYHTGINSGDYGLADCSAQIRLQLASIIENNNAASYKNIIFIAHSFGGIVCRYLLESQRELFFGKKIGLVLMASPSIGSRFANLASKLTGLVSQKQRDELKYNSPVLADLDRRFKRLVHETNRGFELHGIEAYENNKFLFSKIVSQASAARYFGETFHVPKSTHSSIVKPENAKDHSHEILADFCLKCFKAAKSLQATSNAEKKVEATVTSPEKKSTTSTRTELEKALFDIYEPEVLKYYFKRPIDDSVDTVANYRSIWLFGSSGVGKTSIVRRLAGDPAKTIQAYLSNCPRPVSTYLVAEISALLAEKLEIELPADVDDKWLAEKLCNFHHLNGLVLFIDEVPIDIDDEIENEKITAVLSDLVNRIKIRMPNRRIGIAVASINSPCASGKHDASKFSEFFLTKRVPVWDAEEINGLANLIASAVDTDAGLRREIVSLNKKLIENPRTLKTKITHILSDGDHHE